MSSAVLRVELPAYSHSFQVQVPPTSTIREVKQEITRVCPGSPLPDGQRLVFKGRFLSDSEKVEEVWKSPDDSRVVHLAVHPSAWTSAPPSLPSAPSAPSPAPQPTPTPSHRPTASQARQPSYPASYASGHPGPTSAPTSSFPPLAYIQYLHNFALCVLSGGAVALPPQPPTSELEAWRRAAMDVYRNRGWTWPAVFDKPFPSGSPEEGAVYEAVTIEGLPYLSLVTPNATPTPAQSHALQLLSHTFSILSMANDPTLYAPSTSYPTYPDTRMTNLNQRLQELGFPPLRLAHNQAIPRNANEANQPNPLGAPGAPAGAEIRAIPIRALLVPLLMLAFRTVLLLYFFSPSKRPLFGILLSLWVVYEAWTAMRLVFNEGNDRIADAAAANLAAANAPAGQAGAPAPAAPAVANRPNRSQVRSPIQAVIDRLAMMNISYEDALLESDTDAHPPSPLQKTKMFVTLFLLTLYPAAWDRRRTALRRREGRIRTEANAREAALTERAERESAGDAAPARSAEEEARAKAREQLVVRHERRSAWLKQYVQRVQYSEWVDDP
ncbi:hypothetical protein PYCCODRAFT_1438996 [Trametes coccinea BRFM310]|uniref:Ubiquitin-like domain-containing protein n=1 Tax=Trametes coccinea (strain BRFM310) TaxID=1353009 RepID=A0A1Y2IC12_TRAC3|nr:hypothetical protein PYCCODRAFT_1438996 [Trametes coccinea BRFM310]